MSAMSSARRWKPPLPRSRRRARPPSASARTASGFGSPTPRPSTTPTATSQRKSCWKFGGRNVVDPNERHGIAPEIAALTPDLDWSAASVTVLSPARTFWEKATLIHVECHRGRLAASPERLSRHWFDLACLASHDAGRTAIADRALLEDVVRHKTVFFNAGYAHYDRCLDGRFRLVPDDDALAGLGSDYDAMRRAGIVGAQSPVFEDLIERLRALEAEINRRS